MSDRDERPYDESPYAEDLENEAFEDELEEGSEDVAVVAMAGRFPGAPSVDRLWENLAAGRESIRRFTPEELAAAGVDPSISADPAYVPARGVLEGVDLFDADLFGMSPREAAITDPQHRIFLECAWEALEEAGIDPASSDARIGVYGGSILSTYLLLHLLPGTRPEDGWPLVMANDKDTLATRTAYKLGLTGPAVTVQTACSTALVALHFARQSLLDFECDTALAGGVSIRNPQEMGYLYQEEGIFSPDGHCRPFDARARGTVFSSGAGVVVLKRLDDALAGGYPVRAVIRGSAINNDGAGKIGFTAPSLEGQSEVVARALALADVDPETVGYVEAHGTATPIGDPIEIAALSRAFRASGARRKGFCAVGSIKSNVGHLDTAAGAAGLIKAVLALEHGQIPPTLHYRDPNPAIDFAAGPFYVADRLLDWEEGPEPRRAAVSSLGIGGTNAHVILEEAPELEPSPPPARAPQLLVVSGATEAAADMAAERLARHLEESFPEEEPEEGAALADIAFTLARGRRALTHRRAVTAATAREAVRALREPDLCAAGRRPEGSVTAAFLFPGQGAQRPGMGEELYRGEAVFRREIDRAAEVLKPLLEPLVGEGLRELLYPKLDGKLDGSEEEREAASRRAADKLRQTAVTQPALFAVETALARLWESWGITPTAMLGHSVGEYTAAHLAGVMSFEDGLALLAERGRMIGELPGGAMLAVPRSAAEVEPRLGPALSLAAINAPEQCVVSGDEEAVESLAAELLAEGVETRRLRTSHAFHSRQMDLLLEPFQRRVARVALAEPRMPYLSNVSGDWIRPEEATDPAYWARHLREPVRFADGLARLLETPETVLLEVGPGRALSRLVGRQARRRSEEAGGGSEPARTVACLPGSMASANDAEGTAPDDTASVLSALGELWTAGVEVDWDAFYGEGRRRVRLPTYPFDRRRYWVERPAPEAGAPAALRSPAAGDDPAGWFRLPSWRRAPLLMPPAAPASPASADEGGEWLLLVPPGADLGAGLARDIADGLAARLETAGAAVRRIEVGEGTGIEAGSFSSLDLEGSEGASIAGVVHLGGLAGPDSPVVAGGGLDLDPWGLDALEAALAEAGSDAHLVVLTAGALRVTGAETIRPSRAAASGWLRSCPTRRTSGGGRRAVLDLDPDLEKARGKSVPHRLLDDLAAELLAGLPDREAAYRAGDRWTAVLEPLRLPAASKGDAGSPEAAPAWLRRHVRGDGGGGRYLLTGGVDGFAPAFARRLAEAHKEAHPEAGTGAGGEGPLLAFLVQPGEGPGAEESLKTLEDPGSASRARVRVLEAETGSRESLAAALGELAEGESGKGDGSGLDAVFYLPRAPHGADAGAGPAAWAAGAVALASALAEVPGAAPDLFVLFSWHEPPEQAGIAAGGLPVLRKAAAVVDAVAESGLGLRPGGRAVAVDWGPGALELGGFDSDIAWDLLGRVLRRPPGPRVAVLPPTGPVNGMGAGMGVGGGASAGARPSGRRRDRPVTPIPDDDPIALRIAAVWREVLGVEEIGLDDRYFDLGGDSLLALQVMARLREIFPLELPARVLFEHPSVADLRDAVEAALAARIEELSDEEVARLLAAPSD